jgi:hypothetical protein
VTSAAVRDQLDDHLITPENAAFLFIDYQPSQLAVPVVHSTVNVASGRGGTLPELAVLLGGPWSDHLEGQVWELRVRLPDVAARVTHWCTADGRIVLLTVFRKTRQHEQRQIDRAVRAQKICERDHRGPAAETYERQV